MNVDLSQILSWLNIKSKHLGINVNGLCLDSRKIKPGNAFIALNGDDNHGIDFSYQVQRAGASAIIAEEQIQGKALPKSRRESISIPVIEIANLNQKLGLLAANFYHNPSQNLKIIGVTGTNGKTSCTWLLLQAWKKLGINAAYIGTLGYGTFDQIQDQPNTTPNALSLQKMLATFVKQEVTHVSLEVSSHGLELGRVNNVKFSGVGFTNLTHDHLDFHGTMQNYANTKKKLFTDYQHDFCILNKNDNHAQNWMNVIDNAYSYSTYDNKANIYANNIQLSPNGIDFQLVIDKKTYSASTHLLGEFNVENLLLVIAILHKQDFDLKEIIKTIKSLKPVPGRMNRVDDPDSNNPLVIVDYAHTPDALKQVLTALKKHNIQNIWCVFGCGGNRDKGKRPQMGHIAETLADFVIVTDDNPRYEDNTQITQDIVMGMNSKPKIINSRDNAIAYAIEKADTNDIVLIAGKGHENYQLSNGHYHPFDDQLIAKKYLGARSRLCA